MVDSISILFITFASSERVAGNAEVRPVSVSGRVRQYFGGVWRRNPHAPIYILKFRHDSAF